MAELKLPAKARPAKARRKKAAPLTSLVVAETALRIGMICGISYAINERAARELIKDNEGDYRYVMETKAVLAMKRRIMKR